MTRKVLQHLPGSCPADVRFADTPGLDISNHSRPWKVKNVAGCELQPVPGGGGGGDGRGLAARPRVTSLGILRLIGDKPI